MVVAVIGLPPSSSISTSLIPGRPNVRAARPVPGILPVVSQFASNLLDGQVAIVSGGGSGIGRATALELASCGAKIVVTGRRREPLEETVGLAADGLVEALVCDIREEDEVAALVDGVLDRHGRIDLLVN